VSLLWLLVLALVIAATVGGVALSPLLWLILIVAAVVALFVLFAGRGGTRASY
jgi:hypothetical protein